MHGIFSSRYVLRKQMRFEGVILADDLGMGAIAGRYGPGEAAVRTFRAGTDIAMLCHDWSAVAPTIEAVRKALGDGRFEEMEWRASLDRIERVLGQSELPSSVPPLAILGCDEFRGLAAGIRARLV